MSLIRFPLELPAQKVSRPEPWRKVIIGGVGLALLLAFIVYVLIPLMG